MREKKLMPRREFLKVSTLGGVGIGFSGHKVISGNTAVRVRTPNDELKIKEYRLLGRTGFKVSDISAGEHQGNDAILSTLLDAGVNYIDTGESYGRGRDERVIGRVVKKRNRKSVFITTKLYLGKDRTKKSIIERARKCLERLQTDYIDCIMIHSAQNVATVKEKGFHDAMSELKTEGRVRFLGISNHGTFWTGDPEESMEKILLAAAEDGRFDVMLFVYNFLAKENGEKVLNVCSKKNIGTTLMKTNPVADYLYFQYEVEKYKKEGKEVPKFYSKLFDRYEKLVEESQGFVKKHNLKNPDNIRDAAIRYSLNNPFVNSVCTTFVNFDDVEGYLKLSGSRFSLQDKRKLAAYREGCSVFYCRHACGMCEASCPHHVPVNTIMRYNHYFVSQHREKHAMQKYSGLPTAKADRCSNCDGLCEAACPFNVPIHALLIEAHNRLSFT